MKNFYFVFPALLASVIGLEIDLTLEVLPSRRECLFQTISEGAAVDIEYQVIDGGDLDINFVIKNPNGQVMATDIRKTEHFHKFVAPITGDYEFCIDNSFSRFSDKIVYFELMTDEPDEREEALKVLKADEEDEFEMKIEDFRDYVHAINTGMDTSMQTLRLLKSIEARDRFIMERNFERVNFWSCVHLFVLISVGLVQVLTIRSLFADHKPSQGTKQRT